MKNRYRLVRRAYGIYYCLDKQTRKKESLETSDRVKAERLLMAKNQSVEQPALNKGMAKVYLSASSPEIRDADVERRDGALRQIGCRIDPRPEGTRIP